MPPHAFRHSSSAASSPKVPVKAAPKAGTSASSNTPSKPMPKANSMLKAKTMTTSLPLIARPPELQLPTVATVEPTITDVIQVIDMPAKRPTVATLACRDTADNAEAHELHAECGWLRKRSSRGEGCRPTSSCRSSRTMQRRSRMHAAPQDDVSDLERQLAAAMAMEIPSRTLSPWSPPLTDDEATLPANLTDTKHDTARVANYADFEGAIQTHLRHAGRASSLARSCSGDLQGNRRLRS